jgi:membrane-bound lytic murein transglycosylase D
VKKGETVAQIARAYGVSPADIQRANGLSRNASLRPGQHLKLPAGAAQEPSRAARKDLASALAGPLADASERKYVVKRGDTLTEIARAHGVSQEDLRRWNGLERDALLRPGHPPHPDLLVVATFRLRDVFTPLGVGCEATRPPP